ncbi:bifunctional lysylphosphatidylglycerol flippase/synthetase MprF [Paenibacillus humicus]|uniref:bifunctional lysylphosphatidylglycerol flippase/synthetase MprF n=1 Tax=Paenibacillus humicus TaxID=412861 RepID=UPI003F143EA4
MNPSHPTHPTDENKACEEEQEGRNAESRPWIKAVKALEPIYRIKALRLLLPLFVIGLVFFEGRHLFHDMSAGTMLRELRRLPDRDMLLLLAAGLAAAAAMSGYDFVVRRHFRLEMSRWTTFRFGWIANTSNNVLGFAGFTGAGLRALLYRGEGVPVQTAAKAVVFLSPVMIAGLSIMAWGDALGLLHASKLFDAHPWLYPAVWGMALYVPLFLAMQRSKLYARWFNRGESQLPWRVITASLGASLLEWLSAAAVFTLAAHIMLPELPVDTVLGIYVAAAVAGLVSMAPGGAGAFDLIAVLGLQLYGGHANRALAILLLFRIFYYLIPWIIGLMMAAIELIPRRKRNPLTENGKMQNAFNAWQRFWSWPGQNAYIGDVGVWALSKLVLAAGAVLLLSAATPGLLGRLELTEGLLTLPVMHISHHLSVMIGIVLVMLSRGISLKVKRAYIAVLVLLVAGAGFTFAKAFDYEEALFLLLVALLLWISRSRFYRRSAPLGAGRIGAMLGISAVVAFLYSFVADHSGKGFLHHLPRSFDRSLLLSSGEHAAGAALGLAGAWIFLAALLLLRPGRPPGSAPDEQDLEKLSAFVGGKQGNPLTPILYTGDKSLFWAADGEALIPYAVIRGRLVALGDPLGPMEHASRAVQEFQAYADRYAMTPVFYQASPDYLPVYHENGLRFFKLGEEAFADPAAFTLAGKSQAALRSVRNRFDREGFSFRMAAPPHSRELMDELRTVSDAWLGGRREKGFSLGWFKEDYLQRFPIALISGPDGRTAAFASLAPSEDGGRTMSVDLMRHLPGALNGVMDLLFIRLLEWCKAEGFERFNLGMAPLASVGGSSKSFREEKLARLVFQYGGHWYGFQGLRRYKEKFDPAWEPRYLAYPEGASLPLLLLDLVRLVSRKAD